MMNLTVRELRAKAKEVGIKGYSRMVKSELVKAIELTIAQKETRKITVFESLFLWDILNQEIRYGLHFFTKRST